MSAPYKRRRHYRRDFTRINHYIKAPEVRVIDGETGKQLGVLPTKEAIAKAKARGLDLVEVTSKTNPPVCRIVDYGKYKYQQSKQKKERGKVKTQKMKEIKFRVGIDPHDYEIKLSHAEDFLEEGHKLRIQLMFRGRQLAHPELGFEMMERIKEDLQTMAQCDFEPKRVGRNISMMLSPLPEHQRKRKFFIKDKGKLLPEEEDEE